MPLINKQGKVIGVLGISLDITAKKEVEQLRIENENYKTEKKTQEKFLTFIGDISSLIQQYKMDIVNKTMGIKEISKNSIFNSIKLTKREEEIIYFLAMGKSPKEISIILTKIYNKTIGTSTINSMINKRLYPKLDVHNISDLIEKATYLKLIPFIPNGLANYINNQFVKT